MQFGPGDCAVTIEGGFCWGLTDAGHLVELASCEGVWVWEGVEKALAGQVVLDLEELMLFGIQESFNVFCVGVCCC